MCDKIKPEIIIIIMMMMMMMIIINDSEQLNVEDKTCVCTDTAEDFFGQSLSWARIEKQL